MKQISLTKGRFALVDDADFDWLNQWKWHYLSVGYAARTQHIAGGKGKKVAIYMHRLIAGTPPGMETDHRDQDKLNNQRGNLRDAIRSENGRNRGAQKGSSSRFKGVHWDTQRKKWFACIGLDGKTKALGRYPCEIMAAEAYNDAALKYHGEFAFLNVVSAVDGP